MAIPKRKNQSGPVPMWVLALLIVVVILLLTVSMSGEDSVGSRAQPTTTLLQTAVDYHVDDACKNLPTIRESGSYFRDGKIKAGRSAEGVSPAFQIGSYFGEKVQYHMQTDIPMFHLVKSILKDNDVVLDIGANQGFYTYFAATLGHPVHSFEIYEPNFKALQHGAEFNPKEVADRVHLYPVGLGQKNARFSMRGNNYEGFLKEGSGGPIMGVTFDCFAHHMKGKLDLSRVGFVKLDVEGFEIAVLKGAQNSLLKKGHSHIGAMLVEVGPERWGRASVTLASGIEEMKKLSTLFKKSYILLRTKQHAETCPLSLGKDLTDKDPKTVGAVQMFKVDFNEWDALLAKMEQHKYDCNFWYQNA